jgi:dihydroxyacetone kinase
VAGDGDHGTGMLRGLRAASAAARAQRVRPARRWPPPAAAWADRAGGTSGALWGVLLQALADTIGDATAPNAQALAEGIRLGAAEIQQRGRAQLGDKTMLDALLPFSQTLRDRLAAGIALAPAWQAAAEVATERAAGTAELVARVGRARPLAQRGLGTPDAGAVSMALCLTAVAEVLAAG